MKFTVALDMNRATFMASQQSYVAAVAAAAKISEGQVTVSPSGFRVEGLGVRVQG